MSKVFKIGAAVVGTIASVALIASGVGGPLGAGLLSVSWASIAAGAGLAAGVLTLGANLLAKKPGVPSQARERLFASLDPNTPRKIAFGDTAMTAAVTLVGAKS